MPEQVDERAIKFQSAEFRRATTAQVVPPGTTRAAATVRTRLLLRAVGGALLVLLLLAGTAAGVWYASRQQPAAATAAAAPSPTVAPSTPQALAPSPTASPSPSLSLPPLDDNQIRLDLPAWPASVTGCPTGRTVFTNFTAVGQNGTRTVDVRGMIDADVDRDGLAERLYLVRCDTDAADPEEVVAYHASTTRSYEFFGTVAQSTLAGTGTPGSPAFQDIQAVATGPDGTVQLTVADRVTTGPPQQAVVQVRTFSWTGATFQQTSGPTTFQADSSQSRVSMAVEADSHTVRIRITNDGPGAAGLLVFVEVPTSPTAGGDWSRCDAYHAVPGGDSWTMCAVTLRAGVSTQLTLPVAAPTGSATTARVQIRTGDNHFLYAEQTVELATS
jgi:hypothetical protein